MTKKEIEAKIKSLTPKEMIMFMVSGLRNRHTIIAMSTYGYKNQDGICYGCAATNTLCELGLDKEKLGSYSGGHGFHHRYSSQIVSRFENLIDYLRNGEENNLSGFNNACDGFKLKNLKLKFGFGEKLPCLEDNYTEEQLQVYERFANFQES